MALGEVFLDDHITSWEQHFRAVRTYPYRVHWPSRLFHHAPIENALAILREDRLRSRNDPDNAKPRDIAGDGVIDNRPDAHSLVRLYFRPKTPTQFYIEGVRKTDECHQFGHQAPILVMFVLNSRPILTCDGVQFSDINMQANAANVGDDEQFFQTIQFHKVYHEGSYGGDNSITQHRCAEVLCPSPVNLSAVLERICCRSEAEKATLLHLLGPHAARWLPYMKVSDDLAVFLRHFVFVNHVELAPTGIVFELNPRRNRQPVDVRLTIWRQTGVMVANFHYASLNETPPSGGRWRAPVDLTDGRYRVRIELEGHLAYDAEVTLGDILF